MEPGTSREITGGARCPGAACRREETPGEEAKIGEGSAAVVLKPSGEAEEPAESRARCGDDGEAEEPVRAGEEDQAGRYEEELDPRIQAC